MRKAVLDTSSIVSLSLIGILTKCLQIFEITIPKAVVEELEDISSHKDVLGKATRNVLDLVKEGKITVYSVEDKGRTKGLLSSDVGLGEAECIVCCMERRIPLLVMDDVDAMYSLEDTAIANDIETNISVWLIAELVNNKIITKQESVKYVKSLIKLREWEGSVLEVMVKKYLG
ncbi:MAG: hypothetical protein AABW61_00910 [Candidatus Aenigmatarchaeota archaeon]|mgnify:CR=1 FL=1